MDADKVTEKRDKRAPVFIISLGLCILSGILIGIDMNSVPLGVGVLSGLLAIVNAIFFGQDER